MLTFTCDEAIFITSSLNASTGKTWNFIIWDFRLKDFLHDCHGVIVDYCMDLGNLRGKYLRKASTPPSPQITLSSKSLSVNKHILAFQNRRGRSEKQTSTKRKKNQQNKWFFQSESNGTNCQIKIKSVVIFNLFCFHLWHLLFKGNLPRHVPGDRHHHHHLTYLT